MLKWINFLHLYQPATIEGWHIEVALENSYQRIAQALLDHPQARLTINFAGCLIERLEFMDKTEIIEKFKELLKQGRLELVGTAAYHGFLPLLPPAEVSYQIKKNEDLLKKHFGQDIKLRGFYLPEMAYSPEVGQLVKEAGYEWIILDDFSFGRKRLTEKENITGVYEEKSGLKIIFRSRYFSRTYVPETVLTLSKQENQSNPVLITATDAEIYGLRHNDLTNYFEQSLNASAIELLTVSEYIDKTPISGKINISASSWESEEAEIAANLPYAIWANPENEVQSRLWQFLHFVHSLLEKYPADPNYQAAHKHFSLGSASCVFWWISAKDFRQVYGPIAWSPDETDKGLNELIRAARSINQAAAAEKIQAEKDYSEIKYLLWKKHWEIEAENH